MKLKELLDVMGLEERIVIYDRFHRVLEIEYVGDVNERFKKAEIDHVRYSPLHGCISAKIQYGKFE